MAAEDKEFLGFPSFQNFSQSLLKAIVQCTRASNEMARSYDDHEFWTSFEQYREFCATKGVDVLNMIGETLHHQGLQCQWSQSASKRYPHSDIEDRFESIIEANDMLLERIDSQIDEIIHPSKKNKHLATATTPVTVSVVSTWNKQMSSKREKAELWKKFNLITARNIQRPQLKWKQKIDNSNAPFVPILRNKPNAIKEWRPAQRFRDEDGNNQVTSTVEDFIRQQRLGDDLDMFEDRHPYKFELDAFEPKAWQLDEGKIEAYKSVEETPLTIIDDVEQLLSLIQKLKNAKEIAIDLEHHSYRSFLGFTCLMQISTREEDFLIDTISLREDLQVLNEIFTDPAILKVFHGADKDIEWLQRDFGLYVVNMFDTGQASRVLQLARHSLAFLLKEYCSIDASKQYQVADWRLRPIPDEMVKYAREDTHYLLYIHDKLRTTLFERGDGQPNLIKAVYDMSKTVCGKIYEKPIFTPDTYMDICNKYKKHLNEQQLECLKLLVAWRDRTAREEDESYGYVVPNHMMLRIAEQLPRELEGVLACCNPVPPLVKQNVSEICNLVKEARAFSSRRLRVQDGNVSEKSTVSTKNKFSETQSVEILQAEGADSVTGFEIFPVAGPSLETFTPEISLFQDEELTTERTESEKKARLIMQSFRSPFELYLPKTNTDRTDPGEINKRWRESAVENEKEEKRKEDHPIREADTQSADGNKVTPVKRKATDSQKPKTLRDELPKKTKQVKEVIDLDSGSESPVSFSYEKAATGSSFVPFDYSKAGKAKQDTANSKPTKDENLLGKITEQPLKKGTINRKTMKSGAKSFTYKR